jgi:5-hydroxyisourate hydrolase-like protein (transthyretin family)
MRAHTLFAPVAVALVALASAPLWSSGASDAARSLSAELNPPSIAEESATAALVLSSVRRSADTSNEEPRVEAESPTSGTTGVTAVALSDTTQGPVLERPEAMLVVEAVGLDGAAVPGAAVQLELISMGSTGVERHTLERATTDERGRARLAIHDLDEVRAAGVVARLEAHAGAPGGSSDSLRRTSTLVGLTSKLVRLDVPLHAPTLERPVRLVLDAPAAVVVRVTAQGGAPLAQRAVLVDDLDPDLGWWLGGVPTTDELGVALATGLPAGRYRVSLLGEAGVAPRELALIAGERAEVDLVVAVPVLAFAASGHVVDEEGRPLAGREVTALVLGGDGPSRRVDAATDDEGRFELRAAPGERIVVSASLGLFVDEYEPRELDVAFGTRELVFRRTRTVPYEPVVFEVVDESTGQLVRDVLVMTYRALAPGDYAFHNAPEGRAQPRCSIHADTTCLLEAPGYRRRAVLAAELAATAPGGEVPRVTLEPGVLRELRVVDARGVPVAGAVVSRGPTTLGATDPAGLFVVDLKAWPEEGLTITAEQHVPSTWKPRDGFADLTPAEVVLVRE